MILKKFLDAALNDLIAGGSFYPFNRIRGFRPLQFYINIGGSFKMIVIGRLRIDEDNFKSFAYFDIYS